MPEDFEAGKIASRPKFNADSESAIRTDQFGLEFTEKREKR